MAAQAAPEDSGCRRALEDLISLTAPVRAKEWAGKLVHRFGSFGEALAADPADRLALLDGAREVEATFQCLRLAIDRLLRARIEARPVLSTDRDVLDYLRGSMAFQPIEQFRVLFLNAANELLADHVMTEGSVSAVHVYPREIMKRCLELGATAVLLAHNHPSGSPRPSLADRELTRRILQAAQSLDVIVHDHLVIARNGVTSFRKAGYL